MKIRTPDELDDTLAADIAWRKKDLLILKGGLAGPSKQAETAARAAIALAYAHLEGFFKNACTNYLQFLASQPTPLGALQRTHQARALARQIRVKHSGTPPPDLATSIAEAIQHLEDNRHKTAVLPYQDIIKTHANMNSTVLRTILWNVGLDTELFATREHQLDKGLLDSRNHVAHGQYLSVSVGEVVGWIDMVLDMCDALKDRLVNAAASDAWMSTAVRPSGAV